MTKLVGLIDRIARPLLGPWSRASVLCYALAILLLCLSLLVIGFRITEQTNHEIDPFDQGAYVSMSKNMEGSWYPWYSDGTRNPLFPWIAALLLDPESSSFFEKAKRLNVVLAICGIALVGVFFARRLGPLSAFNATMLCSLAALLPISTFFGAEAIFLVLFLFVFACGVRLLNENPLRLYLLLGLLTGVAWLAKPSTTPFIGLFVAFSLIRCLLDLKFGKNLPWHLRAPAWSTRRFGVGLAICFAAYFALISPRLIHAQRTWGSAFYSLPSFWFWADDWQTCVEKYFDCRKARLAMLPIEEQPTLRGYFHRHSLSDALLRLKKGAAVRLQQLLHPEGKWRLSVEGKGKPRRIVLPHRGLYLLALGTLALAIGTLAIFYGQFKLVGSVTLPVLLGLAALAVYILATGWYLPTGPGHRFVMTLYMPLLWMLSQGGEQLRLASTSRLANGLYLAVHLTICSLLLSRVLVLLQNTQFEKISYAF
ncbi:MAG TPA: hypothetical protein VIS99_02600 [Terrimicrobiaceae bacterium]